MLLVIEPVSIQQRREVDVGEVATDELVEMSVDVLEMLVAWESAQRQMPAAALGCPVQPLEMHWSNTPDDGLTSIAVETGVSVLVLGSTHGGWGRLPRNNEQG